MGLPSILGSVAVAAAIFALAASDARAETITGQARVIDGDTIAIGAHRIRLWGIDAPEMSQQCQSVACGVEARRALVELVGAGDVACERQDTDRYGRVVATCASAAGVALNAAMVASGWAVDYTRYSRGAYRTEEAAARDHRLGMWAGSFTPPEQYRRERRP